MAHRFYPALLATVLLTLAGTARPAAAVPTVRLFSGTDTGLPVTQVQNCVNAQLRGSKELVFVEGSSEYMASLFVTEVKGVPSRLYVVNLLLSKPRQLVRGAMDRGAARERGTDLGMWLYQQSFQGVMDGKDPLCADIAQAIRQKILEDHAGAVPVE